MGYGNDQYFVVGSDNAVWTAWEGCYMVGGTCFRTHSGWHSLGGTVFSHVSTWKDAHDNIFIRAKGWDGHNWCRERFVYTGTWNAWWKCS